MSLTDWCAEKIEDHDKVEEVNIADNLINVVHISDVGMQVSKVAVISVEHMDLESLGTIPVEDVDFVLNIKKNPYIEGTVFSLAESAGFAVGGVGDIFRALNDGNLACYQNPEMRFVIRGLTQHTRVQEIERLDDRRFLIHRISLPNITVLVLNDYDLTAEAVRRGIEVYGEFDCILTSNPNCRKSPSSETAASSAGKSIYNWAELLGALSRPWT